MFKCLMGCGCMVHDRIAHMKFHELAFVDPNSVIPQRSSDDGWNVYYAAMEEVEKLFDEHFSRAL